MRCLKFVGSTATVRKFGCESQMPVRHREIQKSCGSHDRAIDGYPASHGEEKGVLAISSKVIFIPKDLWSPVGHSGILWATDIRYGSHLVAPLRPSDCVEIR
ncbi:hypothetical protein CLAIMM_00864 isoform 2 [Cladophialophora immunda]|nr:hypothetical protein CLAIMM_00864 isoform 1 [Cladophialophora immunda]OQU94515.1 hypothetical protein CLAIMM_00864 isoform 2 [Cladophialophora immunda]